VIDLSEHYFITPRPSNADKQAQACDEVDPEAASKPSDKLGIPLASKAISNVAAMLVFGTVFRLPTTNREKTGGSTGGGLLHQ